ncbi:essential MCU regulator, mitochondrial [Cuculus canorus]|uniref:essential MCU regulator, mitochondrial n=1 Tax=Cuculus canorus TaxID=55661 RepID=UPI0023AA38DA|nr:essential MCU regulator, mitochondrial [Cuculus canorus]
MVVAGGRLLAAVALHAGRAGSFRSPAGLVVPRRGATVTRSGAILPKPVKTPFGLLRVFSVVIPFLYVGTQISKNFAALLEEHDIFVPEDDDDDD